MRHIVHFRPRLYFVPQQSYHGPVLFNLYRPTAEIHHVITITQHLTLHHYADDRPCASSGVVRIDPLS